MDPLALIVTTDPELRARCRAALAVASYAVASASDVEIALVLALARRPCVVLLDAAMGRVHGHGLIDALERELDPSRGAAVVLVLGEHGTDGTLLRRARGQLRRTFSAGQLLTVVEVALSLETA